MTEFNYRVYNTIHKGGRARLLLRYKIVLPDRSIIAMKAWAVPRSPRMPEGVKYSLAYIDGSGRRALGYDNAEGKGHHRHEGEAETPVDFESIDAHMALFLKELREIRGIVL